MTNWVIIKICQIRKYLLMVGNLFSNMSRKYQESSLRMRGKTRDGILLSLTLDVFPASKKKNPHIVSLELTPLWTENNNNSADPGIRIRRHETIRKEDPSRGDFLDVRRKAMSFLPLPAKKGE